jgi:predicted nucleic acid-binding protein
MRVIADTTIWSLMLRRRPKARLTEAELLQKAELKELGEEDRLVLLGLIRQELLTGIRSAGHFRRVMRELRAYDDFPISVSTHERAAEMANACMSRGFIATTIDVLICAVARIEGFAVFSSDSDIERICNLLSVPVHMSRKFDGLSTP